MLSSFFIYSVSALSILSKVQHSENTSYINEDEMFNQIAFLLYTFGIPKYLIIRPCQNLHQIIQEIIQHCQSRNYISSVKNIDFFKIIPDQCDFDFNCIRLMFLKSQ